MSNTDRTADPFPTALTGAEASAARRAGNDLLAAIARLPMSSTFGDLIERQAEQLLSLAEAHGLTAV